MPPPPRTYAVVPRILKPWITSTCKYLKIQYLPHGNNVFQLQTLVGLILFRKTILRNL
jgi:hypothetical protein